MTNYQLQTYFPYYSEQDSTYIASSSEIIGNIHIERNVSVWSYAVLRGDNEKIFINHSTNIQEHSMLHTDIGFPLTVGELCTIGHRAILHGCTIGNNTLIGMGAIILNGAKIGNFCLVGAGSLIPAGKEFPDGSLIMGSPAKLIRPLTEPEKTALTDSALSYVENASHFKKSLKAIV